ncbi:MAG: CYTH domain-containing protein [Saccharofermentans sp.]|nr:CYTH domain-containing protein [Saccharofermentans sp.]
MESEVKLAFATKEELFGIIDNEWFSDFCLDTAPKEAVKITNTYYDTPDRAFMKKGGSIRVRVYENEDGKRFEQTVKYGGGVTEGLHQRYEWNVDISTDKCDLSKFKKMAEEADDPTDLFNEILEDIDTDNLVALCSIEIERTTYMFGFGDSMMEACFDYGVIEGNDKKDVICELEIELESGDVVDLKDMAQFIIDNTEGKPYNKSKFQRAISLLDNSDNES